MENNAEFIIHHDTTVNSDDDVVNMSGDTPTLHTENTLTPGTPKVIKSEPTALSPGATISLNHNSLSDELEHTPGSTYKTGSETTTTQTDNIQSKPKTYPVPTPAISQMSPPPAEDVIQ